MDNNSITDNSFEINFVDIYNKILIKKMLLLKITLAFTTIGIIIALLTPNEYTANSTLVPQSGQKSNNGSISGLAAMAGININSITTGDVLTPSIYPKILSNINFQKELIYYKFPLTGTNEMVSYYEYSTNSKYQKLNILVLLKKYTIGLPGLVLKMFNNKVEINNLITGELSNEDLNIITQKEREVIKSINSKIKLVIDDKKGFVQITTTMNDPIIAASITLKTQELLQEYLTKFKLQKVKSNLEFVENNYIESKSNFEAKQVELAQFRDSNKSLTTSTSKIIEEKLTSEYNLLLAIYTEIAKQKEQAKIAIKETTPILTVVEPVVVPNEKSFPNRLLIITMSFILGVIISLTRILFNFRNIFLKGISIE